MNVQPSEQIVSGLMRGIVEAGQPLTYIGIGFAGLSELYMLLHLDHNAELPASVHYVDLNGDTHTPYANEGHVILSPTLAYMLPPSYRTLNWLLTPRPSRTIISFSKEFPFAFFLPAALEAVNCRLDDNDEIFDDVENISVVSITHILNKVKLATDAPIVLDASWLTFETCPNLINFIAAIPAEAFSNKGVYVSPDLARNIVTALLA